ncbi:hypothetical protein [Hymenobacter pini]|uniref:hypothetical protein n=1 Tax=Hymenobacter pini TaxID=2880879 RepID=UPI001CF1B385|nr:hypothetical protein [Hymenobacter pini]MCA8830792.1 hypothetical protein [Hymenobacter pini]
MKNVALLGALLLGAGQGLFRIHDRNEAVQRGAAAYARQHWSEAAAAYRTAAQMDREPESDILLNLAHATLRAGRPAEARGYYSRLTTNSAGSIRSVAFQQLAVIAAAKADYAQAAGLCRQALVANPTNTAARYNYELLRGLLRQPQLPPPPPPGTDGNPNQPASSDGGSKAGSTSPGQSSAPQPASQAAAASQPKATGQTDPNQPSNQPGQAAQGGFRLGAGASRSVARGTEPGNTLGLSDAETGPEATGGTSRRGGTEAASNAEANLQTQQARLQQMNLSTGQARQLLEALQATEQQYLQQLPRKASKPASKDRPGW